MRWFLLASLLALPGDWLADAHAQSGVNLSWDDCGASGAAYKYFACDTNAGSATLYVSAVPGVAMPQLNATEIVIDVLSSQPSISDWWQMQAGCRGQSLSAVLDFRTGPPGCLDVWGGTALGATNLAPGPWGANSMRLRGVAADLSPASVDASTEIGVFAFRMSYQKTVGAGSCDGCSLDKMCMILSSVRLFQSDGAGDITLDAPLERHSVSWRCPHITSGHGPPSCDFQCTTPSKQPTWGEIKSLYH